MMVSNEDIAADLLRNELALLDPAIRRDGKRVRELLAKDFEEIGSSGRRWTLDQVVDLLASEDFEPPVMEAFECCMIAPRVALVTYRTVRADPQSGARAAVLRSSIWIERNGKWKARFHQGTPAHKNANS
jgi:ribonuclease HI